MSIVSNSQKSIIKNATINHFITIKKLKKKFYTQVEKIKEKYIDQAKIKNNDANKNTVCNLDHELEDFF